MDLNRWLAGALPLLALAMMLSGAPHAFGRTGAAHHAFAITLGDLTNWMRKGTALESDIEATEAGAQQALMSAILGGAPTGALASAPTLAAASEIRSGEIGSRVPTD
jgi:hypothetical protein